MVSIRLYVWNVGNISLIQSGCNVKQRAGYRSSSLVFKACLNRIAVSLWYLSSITALKDMFGELIQMVEKHRDQNK